VKSDSPLGGSPFSPLPRYLDNIHLHPEEEKYQKIKLQNKVFQVAAMAVLGSLGMGVGVMLCCLDFFVCFVFSRQGFSV
jgi:hypothetical protein